MKKTVLIIGALFITGTGLMAQQRLAPKHRKAAGTSVAANGQGNTVVTERTPGSLPNRGCATKVPTQQWDAWFNQKVEEHKQSLTNAKTEALTYTVPIIFHVIHGGQAVGTFPNISQAQINSQVTVLNADYGGTGQNTTKYASMSLNGHAPFYDYATTNSLPSPDNNGVIIANTGISFCLAGKDPNNAALAEPGIQRVDYHTLTGTSTYTNTNPAQTTLTANTFSDFIDAVVKPQTIWDPTKYFNVWLTDVASAVGLLGYSTFPSGTTLTGLSGGGSGNANATTDGCWVWTKSCGNTGTLDPTYNLGRTLTHESGHYFGLRHMWGDGTCATDYCNDTPPAQQANYVACSTAYPYNANSCTGSGSYNADGADGEMFMAFMDYSDDCAMWMFTTDQATRMHTALAQCPDRSGLTTSAVSLCNLTVSTPTAAFTPPASICANQVTSFTDASTGPPTSWNWSVSPNTGVTITTNTISNPTMLFSSAGSYTVTDAVSNSSGNNSVSHVVTVTACAATCDTLRNETDLTNLHIYYADAVAPYDSGYLAGTNAYGDLAKAETYTISTANYQIKAIQAYLHVTGTHTVTFNVWADNAGLPGAVLASKTVSLSSLTSNAYNTITLATPYTFTTVPTVFYVGFNIPYTSGDTIACANDDGSGTGFGGFEQWQDNSWHAYAETADYGNDFGNYIFPIICPAAAGIESNNQLGNNINLFPNPNNGQFSFSVTLTEPTNLNFTLVNMLGQSVFAKTENNISHAVLSYDLSSLSKGVYFINITDSQNNKTVKKMIIE